MTREEMKVTFVKQQNPEPLGNSKIIVTRDDLIISLPEIITPDIIERYLNPDDDLNAYIDAKIAINTAKELFGDGLEVLFQTVMKEYHKVSTKLDLPILNLPYDGQLVLNVTVNPDADKYKLDDIIMISDVCTTGPQVIVGGLTVGTMIEYLELSPGSGVSYTTEFEKYVAKQLRYAGIPDVDYRKVRDILTRLNEMVGEIYHKNN